MPKKSKETSGVQHENVQLDDEPQSDDEEEMPKGKEAKYAQIFQKFKLPLDDHLVDRFRCTLEKSISHPGHIYITTTRLLFYSQFPTEEMIQISLVNITSLQKKKTAMLISNAIKITTKERNEYLFANFLRRDHTLGVIERQCKVAEEVLAKKKEDERQKSMQKATTDGLLVKNLDIFDKGASTAQEIQDSILEEEYLKSGKCCCVIL